MKIFNCMPNMVTIRAIELDGNFVLNHIRTGLDKNLLNRMHNQVNLNAHTSRMKFLLVSCQIQ